MKNGKIFTTICKIVTTLVLFSVSPNLLLAKTKITLGLTGTVFKDDLENFKRLEKYLENQTSFDVTIIFSKTYAQAISLIENKSVDVAYICSSTFTKLEQNKTGQLLAIPIVDGSNQYYSYIITKKDATYGRLEDFKDKIFAFTDPDSNSGSIAPKYYLHEKGIDERSYFHKTLYTFEHGESIKAVLEGFVDGASVDNIVYNSFLRKYPETKKRIKVIQTLGPFSNSPIAVREGLDERIFKALQKAFVNMHENKEGQAILEKLSLDRFDLPFDNDYNPIRHMIETIERR
ncbi:MAG: phosphate/phosphite/phosphonate ABC transporter substrate-binding protein [Campylobacteraceae bacterium]|nr:phosphate/phosphite/phosphonate ABC transporter substrate-binding protein [Campylobacteraceae bacterium]